MNHCFVLSHYFSQCRVLRNIENQRYLEVEKFQRYQASSLRKQNASIYEQYQSKNIYVSAKLFLKALHIIYVTILDEHIVRAVAV